MRKYVKLVLFLAVREEFQPLQSANAHQFTGHERDVATGLDYMLARYYSHSLARFGS